MTDEALPTTDLRTLRGVQRQLVSDERKLAAAKLLNRGYSLREAAGELGLTFGQVRAVQRALVRESEKQFAAEADKLRARLLQQNRVLQRECWDHLERAKLGHIRQEVEDAVALDSAQVASGAISQKSSVVPGRRRTIRENDLMAEARILETLRKAQADEAKILGWRPPDEPTTGDTTNVDARSITIINAAGLSGSIPWLDTIAPGFARQGVGVLPPGSLDPIEAELSPSAEEGTKDPTSSAEGQPEVAPNPLVDSRVNPPDSDNR